MAVCEPCRRECQASHKAIASLREHWAIRPDTRALLEKIPAHRIPVRTAAARWTIRVSAVAACLVVGVFAWQQMPGAGPERSTAPSGIASLVPAPAGARVSTLSGTSIQMATDRVESLILGGRHQLVMNAGSRLSVEPLVENSRIGCLVRLDAGEICAHVEHDGGRFVVQTAHGRVTITGTVFDVKVTAAETRLIVAEGSVRFESLDNPSPETSGVPRVVQVTAGQQSVIRAALRLPSPPAVCDAAALTAWAGTNQGRFRTPAEALAKETHRWELPLPAAPWAEIQTDANGIDAVAWIEQNREWFRQQFPWIFELRDALATEDRRAPAATPDYPALLLRSGDLWRFVYPPADASRQVEPDPNNLLRAAVAYGRDESWLRRQLFLAEYATGRPQQAAGAAAFEQWVQDLQAQSNGRLQEMGSQELHGTLDACTYLVQTRTLALLMLNQDPGSLTGPVKREMSVLFQEELRILSWCLRLSYELGLGWPGVSSCECSDKIGSLLQGIRELAELEKQIRERLGAVSPLPGRR